MNHQIHARFSHESTYGESWRQEPGIMHHHACSPHQVLSIKDQAADWSFVRAVRLHLDIPRKRVLNRGHHILVV